MVGWEGLVSGRVGRVWWVAGVVGQGGSSGKGLERGGSGVWQGGEGRRCIVGLRESRGLVGGRVGGAWAEAGWILPPAPPAQTCAAADTGQASSSSRTTGPPAARAPPAAAAAHLQRTKLPILAHSKRMM